MSGYSRYIALFVILLAFSTEGNSAPYFQKVVSELSHDIPSIIKCWTHRYFDPIDQHSEFPTDMEGEIPIILIHGYMHDISGWKPFRNALQEVGLGPVYVPRLTNSSGDIRYSAKEIASVIRYILEQTGQSQVILIGHSMGGIVAAYCTQHYADEGTVKAVITIGAPLQGTRLAHLGFGKASRQMSYRSPFLQKLTAHMTYNPKTEYYCFGSIVDEVIKPYQNAFYKTPDDLIHFRLYSDVGHQSYLFDEDVINEVILMIDALDNGGGDHPKMLVELKPIG